MDTLYRDELGFKIYYKNVNVDYKNWFNNIKLFEQIIKMKSILFLLAIVLCFPITTSKYFSNEMSIGQWRRKKGWVFVDRMSFDEGVGYAKLTLKITTSSNIVRE